MAKKFYVGQIVLLKGNQYKVTERTENFVTFKRNSRQYSRRIEHYKNGDEFASYCTETPYTLGKLNTVWNA